MTAADIPDAITAPSADAVPAPGSIRPPEVIRAEIALTRAELSETVSALAAKTDVKARTKYAVTDVTDQIKHATEIQVRRPTLWIAMGAALAVVGGLIWWRQRR